MIMGIHDVLKMAQTPEEREEIRARFYKRMDEKRIEVDLSDMPEAKDPSRFRPLKPYLDKMRAHNMKVYEERMKREQELAEPILTK